MIFEIIFIFFRDKQKNKEEMYKSLVKYLPISQQSSQISTNKSIEKSIENKIIELEKDSWKYQIQPLPSI